MTEASVTVRDARADDAGAIAAFNAAMALASEHKTLDPALLRAGVDAVFADAGHGFYLVAEVDGRVAACLMITY
jgi:hypothetical protein